MRRRIHACHMRRRRIRVSSLSWKLLRYEYANRF
jgi:hypothetical protein